MVATRFKLIGLCVVLTNDQRNWHLDLAGTPLWIQAVMVVCFCEVWICRAGTAKVSAGATSCVGFVFFQVVTWDHVTYLLIRSYEIL